MRVVDLSQETHEHAPQWPGGSFTREQQEVDPDVQLYHMSASSGTHIDAPAHFHPGGRRINELLLEELIGPGCVMPIDNRPDAQLLPSHIEAWEEEHGPLPAGSVVLIHSGWSARWNDPDAYLNLDEQGHPQIPSLSGEAAKILVERNVAGVGIDSLSLDTQPPFAAHSRLLPADKFFIENLTHLDQLPPVGATILALPAKIRGAAEAPARVIALVEEID